MMGTADRVAVIAACVVVLLPAAVVAESPSPAPSAPAVVMQTCQLPGVSREARCGTLEVFENRAAATGRTIALKIVVLPATGPERLPDPFVFLHGGPGAAATGMAAALAAQFHEINTRRDILLVDQRGTGGSNPLDIDLHGSSEGLASKLGPFIPPAAACAGAARLAESSDLTQYTTPIAMDDLDDVRVALGYEKLNLYGASYGTRAAMAYLRQHPERVRTVVLAGVTRFDDHIPVNSPRNTQRALDGLIAECAADPGCHAAFPDLASEVGKVLATLEAGPVSAPVLDPRTGELVSLPLSRELAAEALRYMLYLPSLAVQVPAVVHQAAAGDWGPLTEMALFGRLNIVGSTSDGMFLAVICSEDVAFIDPEEGERRAAGTFMGPDRLHQLQAACRCFPRSWLPPDYGRPVRSEVPALVVSGALDPATPPSNGDYVASYLSKGRHVVVPKGAHDAEGMKNAECIPRLITDLVTSGTTDGLDTSCVATIERQPFLLAPIPSTVVSVPAADLDRLAGGYVIEGQGFEVAVRRDGGRLRLEIPDGPSFLLAPLSPTRFKVVGPPGFHAAFAVEADAVRRLEMEQGGSVTMVFVPEPAAGSVDPIGVRP